MKIKGAFIATTSTIEDFNERDAILDSHLQHMGGYTPPRLRGLASLSRRVRATWAFWRWTAGRVDGPLVDPALRVPLATFTNCRFEDAGDFGVYPKADILRSSPTETSGPDA